MDAKESSVQTGLVDTLEREFPGIYLRKIHQTMYSHAGIPDLLFCLNGHFGAIEVKTLKGKTTKLQDRELKLITEAGGIALVCHGHRGVDACVQVLRPYTLPTPTKDHTSFTF